MFFAGKKDEAFQAAKDGGPLYEAAIKELKSVILVKQDSARKEFANAEAAYATSRTTLLILVGAGLLVGQGLGYVLARLIARLTASLNRTLGQMSDTARSISENAVTLAGAAEQMTGVSQQMSATAEETAAQANVVSAAAEQVSHNVQTVSTATEEMSASIKEIAHNAHEAARVATTAVRAAETTDTAMSRLGESSMEIGKVVKVITSIAEQTNLLALNATIEAARAGEAGKAFAVVANEVKELAKETARATEDIGRKVEAIQTYTRGAVDAIGQIGAVIHQINDISNTIASAVEEQTATTNEIGRNVAEAARGSVEIAQNITAVAEAARNTTEGANNTQQAAAELAHMAAELQQLVGQFQSGQGADVPPPAAPARSSHDAARPDVRPHGGSNGKERRLNGHGRPLPAAGRF